MTRNRGSWTLPALTANNPFMPNFCIFFLSKISMLTPVFLHRSFACAAKYSGILIMLGVFTSSRTKVTASARMMPSVMPVAKFLLVKSVACCTGALSLSCVLYRS